MELLSITSIFIAGRSCQVKNTQRHSPSNNLTLRNLGREKRNLVTPGRFELPTRSLGNCCSIHLSYGATFKINNLNSLFACPDLY